MLGFERLSFLCVLCHSVFFSVPVFMALHRARTSLKQAELKQGGCCQGSAWHGLRRWGADHATSGKLPGRCQCLSLSVCVCVCAGAHSKSQTLNLSTSDPPLKLGPIANDLLADTSNGIAQWPVATYQQDYQTWIISLQA